MKNLKIKKEKFKVVWYLLLVFFLGGLGGLFLDRLILPHLATVPFFRNVSILNPNAPIVITRREEIRITDGVNLQEVINRVKNSIATIYVHTGDFGSADFRVLRSFTGAVVTSDGIIAAPFFDVTAGKTAVVLSDGAVLPARVIGIDQFTGVAFLQVTRSDMSVINQGFSTDLKVSEDLLAIWASETAGAPRVVRTVLSAKSVALPSMVREYDFVELNGFLTVDYENWAAAHLGAVLVNRDSAIVGLVTQFGDEIRILRSEDLKLVIDNILDDQRIAWPRLNIAYKILGEEQTGLLSIPKKYGILLTRVSGPFRVDDFIYEVDGQTLALENDFQKTMFKKKPGDNIKIKLLRNGEEILLDVIL